MAWYTRAHICRLVVFVLGHIRRQRQIGETLRVRRNRTGLMLVGRPGRQWHSDRRRRTQGGVPDPFPPLPLSTIRPPRSAPLSVFLSYKWGVDGQGRNNNKRVQQLALLLNTHGVCTWFDAHSMESHHMVQSMCNGIDCCHAMVVCVTRAYIESCGVTAQSNCRMEMDYAHTRDVDNRRMLPVVMEEGCVDTTTWNGPVGAYLSKKRYVNMTSSATMLRNVDELVGAIRAVATWRAVGALSRK